MWFKLNKTSHKVQNKWNTKKEPVGYLNYLS